MLRSKEEVLPMKIAQIAPLYERVPPMLYGGTERIVSYLTEELVRQGHQVTLFASGDSQTQAALVGCSDAALRLNPLIRDPLPYHLMMMEEVRRRAAEFDVLHFHTDLVHFPLLPQLGKPTLTTVHGRVDLPDLRPFYDFFSKCRWFRSPRINAGLCRPQIGPQQYITGCLPMGCRSARSHGVAILHSLGVSRLKSARTAPSKLPPDAGCR
jgi:glycosyltransferase involved in cell wall biosynthesis